MPGDILYPKLLGEVTVDGDNDSFTLAEVGVDLGGGAGVAVPLTLTNGRYPDVRVLCNDAGADDFESTISGVGAGQNYTVSIVDSTGIVSIAALGVKNNFSIVWTDVALRDLLGFTGNLAGANAYTAPNQHQLSWYCDNPPTRLILDPTERRGSLTVADDGTPVGTYWYEHALGTFAYRYVVDDEHTEIVDFWEDIVRRHATTFNLYPNRDDNALYDRDSNPDGRQRWVLHEGVKGLDLTYPHTPQWNAVRALEWRLRRDVGDSKFVSVGT